MRVICNFHEYFHGFLKHVDNPTYILYIQRYIYKDPLCNINFIFEKTKTEPTAELTKY